MASHGEKDRFRRHLWAVARQAGGDDIEIARDPLHKRYEVNRHGLKIEAGNLEQALEVFGGVIHTLGASGWSVRPVKGRVAISSPEHPGVYGTIDTPMNLADYGGGARIDIHISDYPG